MSAADSTSLIPATFTAEGIQANFLRFGLYSRPALWIVTIAARPEELNPNLFAPTVQFPSNIAYHFDANTKRRRLLLAKAGPHRFGSFDLDSGTTALFVIHRLHLFICAV
jgi:hypothetical protein